MAQRPNAFFALSFLVFFLSSLVSGQSDCDNPLGLILGLEMNESPVKSDGACATALGGSTCCSSTHDADSETLFEELYDKYKENARYYPALVGFTDEFLDYVYEAANEKLGYTKNTESEQEEGSDDSSSSSSSSSEMGGDSSSDYEQLTTEPDPIGEMDPEIKTITMEKWEALKESFPGYMETCHQQLFNIGTAFRCVACDPNYEEYMEENYDNLKVFVSQNNCDSLMSACTDMTLVASYARTKLLAAALVVIETEFTLGHTDLLKDGLEFGTDYQDNDYETSDAFEEIDLLYETVIENCRIDVSNAEEVLESQLGLFGPSVLNLMLEANNFYVLVEEVLNWVDGESSIFNSEGSSASASRRLRESSGLKSIRSFLEEGRKGQRERESYEKGKSKKKMNTEKEKEEKRRLWGENTFTISFDKKNESVDLATIAAYVNEWAPDVKKLEGEVVNISSFVVFLLILGNFL